MTPIAKAFSLGLGSAFIVACAADAPSVSAPTNARAEWFTPGVAALIDKNGFLPATEPLESKDAETTSGRAKELALKLVREFGNADQVVWTLQAGYSIVASELKPCGRVDFIEHPYRSIPAGASNQFKARFGSQWLVRFCSTSNIPVVEWYISAQGLDAFLDSLGNFRTGVPLDGFSTRAINRELPAAETSEEASQEVFRRNRRQISALPRVLRVGRNSPPWIQSWALLQRDAGGNSSTVSAFPFGRQRTWVVRDSNSGLEEADTLIDHHSAPVVVRILQRRTEAAGRSDLLRNLGL